MGQVADPLDLSGRLLVIFDGHCGLCLRSVQWLVARDRRDRLRFVSAESAGISGLLVRHGFGESARMQLPRTILVVRGAGSPTEQILTRSGAILALLAELPRPWPVVAAVLRWVPRPLRDLAYGLIARWRYRLFGRVESCPLPSRAERDRFL